MAGRRRAGVAGSLGRALALPSLLACLTASTLARAQPSVWDAARDPTTVRDYRALTAVERMLARAELSAFDPHLQHNFVRAALAMLELAGGGEVGDVRLRYLLGDLLADASVQRDADARRLLESALAAAPDSPLAGRGWFNLAIASARLGDAARERDAYSRALEHVWERDFRANILMNRGESSMVLGELERALADYRRAIRLADRPDLQALAHFGLGVALERSGDLPAALAAMSTARGVQLPGATTALDLGSVFFVPWYDVHYYKALSAMAGARDAEQPTLVTEYLLEASGQWQAYLEAATPDAHRWVPNARRHAAALAKKLGPTARPTWPRRTRR